MGTVWVDKKKPLENQGVNYINGTSGRTRTDTLLKASDFESDVSTNFTTLA